MKEKRVTKLACGGKGPCCHIGYPHRHCEHCDVVISLHQCFPQPWYRPGGPYWLGSTGSISAMSQGQSTAAQQLAPANSLSEPTNVLAALGNGHTCEVK